MANKVRIVSMEPYPAGSFEESIGATFRLLLSNGDYLEGAAAVENVPASAASFAMVKVSFPKGDFDTSIMDNSSVWADKNGFPRYPARGDAK